MDSVGWKEIRVAEDATHFKEHFVVFKSEPHFHYLTEFLEFTNNGEKLKIGYINHPMYLWSTPTREAGYNMDFLVARNRTASVYDRAPLVDSILKLANLSFRFLSPEELAKVYLILFFEQTGKMNGSIGGIHLLSIRKQLLKENSDVDLPFYNIYLHEYTDESLWSKYEYPNE